MRRSLLPLAILLTCAQPVWAHPGHVGHAFAAGWQHPLAGLDHLLAIVAVGILAVRIGGKAIWAMPTIFLASMLVGGAAAACGIPLPASEWVISLSVLILGLMVAVSRTAPLAVGGALVALFAIFHGHAHVAEMASGGSLTSYAVGFVLATAVLHVCGVLGGLIMIRSISTYAVRWSGAFISIAGVLLLCGAI